MRINRRIAGFGLLILAVAGACFLPPVRVGWHKWRLRAAKNNCARLLDSAPSRMDELKAIVRGEPMSSEDYHRIAVRHARALVDLGFLRQAQFRIESPDPIFHRRLAGKLESMNENCEWWTYQFSTPSTNIAVIGCDQGIAIWQGQAEGLPLQLHQFCCAKPTILAEAQSPSVPR